MPQPERLTDEELRYERDFPITVRQGDMAAELLALRAEITRLREALEKVRDLVEGTGSLEQVECVHAALSEQPIDENWDMKMPRVEWPPR